MTRSSRLPPAAAACSSETKKEGKKECLEIASELRELLEGIFTTSNASKLCCGINKNGKKNIFYLAVGTFVIYAIHRLSVAINILYHSIVFDPPPALDIPDNSTRVYYNYWPSHIMGAIEFLLILFFILYMAKEIKK